jgi:alpha 1,2-mannosyltransferase
LDKYILSPGISDKDRPTELAVDKRRANATFVILARNSDADGTVRSIREMEDRFNRNYNYPYVLLNEEEFSDDFKRYIVSGHRNTV